LSINLRIIIERFNGGATKSIPAFVGSQTEANCRVVYLSGLSTADVGPVDSKLSGCLFVGPVNGRCRACRQQIVGLSSCRACQRRTVWFSGCRACRRQMSGLLTAKCLVVGPLSGRCLVVWPVNGRCLVVLPVNGKCLVVGPVKSRCQQTGWLANLSFLMTDGWPVDSICRHQTIYYLLPHKLQHVCLKDFTV
jgi:hypothetical protein